MTVLMFLERVIVPALVIFLLLGSLASAILGCALVFRTARALDFVRRMNRWVSTRRVLRQAELPRSAGEPSRRGGAALGLFLLAGGAFALYFLVFRVEIPRAAVVFGVELQRWFVLSVVLQTLKWFLAAGSVLAIAVGVLILFFPGGQAAFEARMNRWYSTRRLLPPGGETMKLPLEMLVEAYPRPAGWAIAGASLLVALAMAILLAARVAG